jgi:hypothetical protein
MDLRRYQQENDQRGATGSELVNEERSLPMVRKLAMGLSRAECPYVGSQNSPTKKTDAVGNHRTVSFTRYYLTEKKFVKWPRTAVFLMECRSFRRDENGTIAKQEFADWLKVKHGFNDVEFKEDWRYVLPRGYIHEYGSKFSTGRRIEAEREWLELLAREHKAKSTPRRSA